MAVKVSPRLLKYLFGQHILNGLAVAAGVGVVVGGMTAWLGFAAGMAAGSGAICVSVGDQPSPLSAKIIVLPIAWVLAVIASLAAVLSVAAPPLEGATVVIFGVVAGLLLGWGRWAIPLSVLTMLAIVFTLGAPISDLAEGLRYEALFAAGGAAYVVAATAFTHLLDASSKRLTVGECMREFAAYLRAVAAFYEPNTDRAGLYLRVLEQQASLSDHLQTARALLFSGRERDVTWRLAAALVVLLDSLDAVIAANADQAPQRLVDAASPLAGRIGELIRLLASDLDRLALDLLAGQNNLVLPDRRPAVADLAADIARLEIMARTDPRLLRAARMTRSRFAWAISHLARLPAVLARRDAADEILQEVDLKAFVQPQSRSPAILLSHLRFPSPVFRHAIRLGLSLGTGYALIALVPGLTHGNWILLTTAVILRASYSVTRQRRNDRLIGTLVGCAITGALLLATPPLFLLASMLVAVAIAHAFARVHYRVTSAAACVMALLSLHFLDPVDAPPVLARMLDTLIGASIAYLFSHILPRWEHQDAPQLVASLLRSTASYARQCLQWYVPQQAYRLARKQLIEALAALSESAARMKGEPVSVRGPWPGYGRLLAAAYTTAAQIVTIRFLIRNRLAELDPALCTRLLDATRLAVLAVLDPAQPESPGTSVSADVEAAAATDAFKALVQRCADLRRAAAELRRLADAQRGG
jgi:uncharacterized membrane protein YccC